ncbi:Bst1p [Sporobolomyces koalae]|uniref:Bst1p n=1 Tax=Sporobolomyces koalae TaxID=500713 RepID=UPI003175FC50
MVAPNTTASPRLDRLVLGLSTLSAVILWVLYSAYVNVRPVYPPGSLPEGARGQGAGACRMTYMSPSYLHIAAFNRTATRLGSGPWGLYLYREAGWDEEPLTADGQVRLGGTPVLFVPGNAGSFKQVRSLASTATRTFWELPGVRRNEDGLGAGASSLDFFTLDLNDDFSAFHGQTLFDQAEYTADAIKYILGLYAGGQQRDRPDPTSLIVVAHSMGGIVARAAFLDKNFQANSVSTLITFATPHLVPPVTIDSGIDRFYHAINSYWQESINPASPRSDVLKDVVVISISGGISDEMIASEAASLSSLVPDDDSRGFSVSTTAIPGVNTPIDHLAILWCQQLMQVVAESLLAIIDVRKPDRAISRQARVGEFKARLLESSERKDPINRVSKTIQLDKLEQGTPHRLVEYYETLSIQAGSAPAARTVYLMPMPTDAGRRELSLLTTGLIGDQQDLEVYTCTTSSEPQSRSVDPRQTSCNSLSSMPITKLPASIASSGSPTLPAASGDGSMNLLTVGPSELGQAQFVAVVYHARRQLWALAEVGKHYDPLYRIVDRGAFRLLFSGYIESIPMFLMMSEFSVLALDTSLLKLKFKLYGLSTETGDLSAPLNRHKLFAPLLRQYSTESHESKYYPNSQEVTLYTHAHGPFIPSFRSSDSKKGETRLQLFIDPTPWLEGGDMGDIEHLMIKLTVDVMGTLGSLFVRYRMALVTLPFAIVLLVLAVQLHDFHSGLPFPSFGSALSTFSRQHFASLLIAMLALGYIQSILLATITSRDIAPSTWLSDALLGNSGSFWAPVLPLLTVASFVIVVLEYMVLSSMVNLAALFSRFLMSPSRNTESEKPIDLRGSHLSPVQRTLAIGFLLAFTLFFAPYQFAYLVLFLIHLLTTFRLLINAQHHASYTSIPASDSSSARTESSLWDEYHFSFSILFVLLALLPINALILVVWVRNLAVGSFAPFSSDHNVLSVLGFLALVESLHSGRSLPRSDSSKKLFNRVTMSMTLAIAAYSVLYGIRTAYRTYTYSNLFAGWLAFVLSGILSRNRIDKDQPHGGDSTPSNRKIATTTTTTISNGKQS